MRAEKWHASAGKERCRSNRPSAPPAAPRLAPPGHDASVDDDSKTTRSHFLRCLEFMRGRVGARDDVGRHKDYDAGVHFRRGD